MKDKKYHNDPYRAVNFKTDENGKLICPEGRKFNYLKSAPVKGNQYGRTQAGLPAVYENEPRSACCV